ncbi:MULTISPECIES: YjcZ family sporulation protein [Brevibacillus]|uniref:YjcZ family sporulation protein n=1 Tax=Brevibacillus invocatus TaxID=173959 RepID=A0A3M8CG98_9BACL|nr:MULTISPECIES: YjcZ family sporulation protein [Brevibacillus]MCM3081897.1 YjcZ family sporulation protein [Brevibacillus invocatus]MCM3432303.1 YjcZ family sporulation protein [Brevibacillus invocatus]MDH4618792.1 YjcZ family sporulation protein [Brevibacillus sp. AY1]RNB74770.1 YjcZ family sporulation protein [Brevibacillus invocatus]
MSSIFNGGGFFDDFVLVLILFILLVIVGCGCDD